jgi:hypothetical protein
MTISLTDPFTARNMSNTSRESLTDPVTDGKLPVGRLGLVLSVATLLLDPLLLLANPG